MLTPLDWAGPWWMLLLFHTEESKLDYLPGKSQPTKLGKQSYLRLRKNTAQNKLLFLPIDRPIRARQPAPPVCHWFAKRGNISQWIECVSEWGPKGLKGQ